MTLRSRNNALDRSLCFFFIFTWGSALQARFWSRYLSIYLNTWDSALRSRILAFRSSIHLLFTEYWLSGPIRGCGLLIYPVIFPLGVFFEVLFNPSTIYDRKITQKLAHINMDFLIFHKKTVFLKRSTAGRCGEIQPIGCKNLAVSP